VQRDLTGVLAVLLPISLSVPAAHHLPPRERRLRRQVVLPDEPQQRVLVEERVVFDLIGEQRGDPERRSSIPAGRVRARAWILAESRMIRDGLRVGAVIQTGTSESC
jgi:hypothetical protein